jgi:hypothetical protein
MSERFEDLLTMEIPDWVINPFLENIEVCNDAVEEELTGLKYDIELKPMFKKSYKKFWLQKEICVRYPALWTIVKSNCLISNIFGETWFQCGDENAVSKESTPHC